MTTRHLTTTITPPRSGFLEQTFQPERSLPPVLNSQSTAHARLNGPLFGKAVMNANDATNSRSEPHIDWNPIVKKCLYVLLAAMIAYVVYDRTQQDYSSRYAFGFTGIGIWAFGITAFLIGYLCLPSTRHRFKKASIPLVIYVGSYVYLTAGGAYYFSQSGQTRYSSGLSVSDVSIWHPRFLYWEPFQNIQGKSTSRGSTLGYYFSPLIAVDRYWLHPTQQLLTDDEPAATGAK